MKIPVLSNLFKALAEKFAEPLIPLSLVQQAREIENSFRAYEAIGAGKMGQGFSVSSHMYHPSTHSFFDIPLAAITLDYGPLHNMTDGISPMEVFEQHVEDMLARPKNSVTVYAYMYQGKVQFNVAKHLIGEMVEQFKTSDIEDIKKVTRHFTGEMCPEIIGLILSSSQARRNEVAARGEITAATVLPFKPKGPDTPRNGG